MKRLPSSSRGCALPAKMNWTGRCLSCAQFHDVLELLEDQRRALVGGEAAGEADGQRVGIQQMVEPDEVALRDALSFAAANGGGRTRSVRGAAGNAAPRVPRRKRNSGSVIFSQNSVWLTAVAQSVPNFSRDILAVSSSPLVSFLPPELTDGTFHPAEQVDAVGDVADGHIVNWRAGIKTLPHVRG